MKTFDVVIVGAGAAGLFCAGVAAQQGLQVLVLDHSEKVAEKIRISGGGRSNFTNQSWTFRINKKILKPFCLLHELVVLFLFLRCPCLTANRGNNREQR